MEIEVMRHKGQIYEVRAMQAGFIWPREDTLLRRSKLLARIM